MPVRANSRHIAAPKPEPPPVTAAIFPTRSSTFPTAPGLKARPT
jgi:hypothetical protein